MKPTEYIINEIDKLIEKHETIKLRYEYNAFFDAHSVEVSPSSYFEENEEFCKDDLRISLEFIEKYPFEALVFKTEDAVNNVKEPIYVKIGNFYNEGNENLKIEASELIATSKEKSLTSDISEYALAA